MKKYDTTEKRIATLKKKGNIITFKELFYPRGTSEKGFSQILVEGLEKNKGGAVKIIGFTRDTKWFDTITDLIEAVDWDLMEKWH